MSVPASTVADLIDRALDAYELLVTVAESIDDEWQYIADLSGAWRARLREVGMSTGPEVPPPGASDAIEAAAAEIALIADPHRAIDWLSTYPLVVLVALGVRP